MVKASSANGRFKHYSFHKAGFTLLEILIVLVLIAVLSAAVILSVSGGVHRQLKEEALMIQSTLQLAADEAVYSKSSTGVIFTQSDYTFEHYDNVARKWVIYTDRALRRHAIAGSLKLSLNSDNTEIRLPFAREDISQPSLIFLPTGEMTPFKLAVTAASVQEERVISTDGIAPIAEQEGTGDASGQ